MTVQETNVQEVTTVRVPTERVVSQTKVVSVDSRNNYQAKKAIFRTYQVVWYFLGVIEAILAFRVVFKFLGANTYSGFTNFIYMVSSPLAVPFAGIVQTTGISDMVIEWSTLIAMAVYAIGAYGIVALLQFVKPTNPEEVAQTIDNQ